MISLSGNSLSSVNSPNTATLPGASSSNAALLMNLNTSSVLISNVPMGPMPPQPQATMPVGNLVDFSKVTYC